MKYKEHDIIKHDIITDPEFLSAVQLGDLKFLNKLREKNQIDYRQKNIEGKQAVHLIYDHQDPEILHFLRNNDPDFDINELDDLGISILFETIRRKNYSFAKILIAEGADLLQKEQYSSPLYGLFSCKIHSDIDKESIFLTALDYELSKKMSDRVFILNKFMSAAEELGEDSLYSICFARLQRESNKKKSVGSEKMLLDEINALCDNLLPQDNKFRNLIMRMNLSDDHIYKIMNKVILSNHDSYLDILLNQNYVNKNVLYYGAKFCLNHTTARVNNEMIENMVHAFIKMVTQYEKKNGTWYILPDDILYYDSLNVLHDFHYEIYEKYNLNNYEHSNSLLRYINNNGVNAIIDDDDNNLLHSLSEYNAMESVRLVIDMNIDINAVNKFGETALVKASYRQNHEIICLLLDKGADASIKDLSNKNMLDHLFCDIVYQKSVNEENCFEILDNPYLDPNLIIVSIYAISKIYPNYPNKNLLLEILQKSSEQIRAETNADNKLPNAVKYVNDWANGGMAPLEIEMQEKSTPGKFTTLLLNESKENCTLFR